jgi:hypothetical protein
MQHDRDYRNCDHAGEDEKGQILAPSFALIERLHGLMVRLAKIVDRRMPVSGLAFPLINDLTPQSWDDFVIPRKSLRGWQRPAKLN